MQAAINVIQEFEGLKLSSYLDSVGVPTIGWGTTIYPSGMPVKLGQKITENEAKQYLELHLEKIVIPQLEKIPTWNEMNYYQECALISFAYNMGSYFYGDYDNFISITQLLNQPELWTNKIEVNRVFGLYIKGGGKILQGLVRRRKAEAELWLTPVNSIRKKINSMCYELIFSQHFDRETGQDYGRLLLKKMNFNTPSQSKELEIWIATSSHAALQDKEDFHQKGGLIPPAYRCPDLGSWTVETNPISMPNNKGVQGSFYKINPYLVKTDKGGSRGDFGIHLDANVEGSLGCIVMDERRFKIFENWMSKIKQEGFKELPLTVIYS